MPTHVYLGSRRPPTWFDHVLAHPYELALALYGILGGIGGFIAAFSAVSISPSLDQLPAPFAGAAALLLLVGGGGIFHGLFDSSDDLGIGFTRERMGLVLQAAGWAIYGICVWALNHGAVFSWGLCLALVLAHGLRFEATRRQEKGIRTDLATAKLVK